MNQATLEKKIKQLGEYCKDRMVEANNNREGLKISRQFPRINTHADSALTFEVEVFKWMWMRLEEIPLDDPAKNPYFTADGHFWNQGD